jgi:hypothetical protein
MWQRVVVVLGILAGMLSMPEGAAVAEVDIGAPQIPVARVMRDYQTKYNALTGGYITWPRNARGTLAPVFPDDNFYAPDLKDPATAARLVDALWHAYADSATQISTSYVNPDDENLGAYSAPTYPSTTGVTSTNYQAQFNAVAEGIQGLALTTGDLSGFDLDGQASDVGLTLESTVRAQGSGLSLRSSGDCATAKALALASFKTAAYSEFTPLSVYYVGCSTGVCGYATSVELGPGPYYSAGISNII